MAVYERTPRIRVVNRILEEIIKDGAAMTHRGNAKGVQQDSIVGGLKRKGEKKMARYIDAVELIKVIEENQRNTEHHKDGRGKQIHVSEHRHFIKMVYEQPTADVQEVRHGRWVEKEYYTDGEKSIGMVCCHCGANQVAGLGLAKYCYMCGAKMDGEE